ncbi:hypothetical protein Cgig2_026139 [Carnegiea gigantea]|uniref:Transmembrane protein n=1 Tax=Carnegiea gigantea TaxID=171969 RepID=A0A9Q1GGR9_9CARY|nr:hypothetical protein Cgig2_026103 [Carnegiea gigantea]KAJ8432809.1 hypothetical protein Cgig2_026139 [Carnegiea gigantea]
MFSTLRLQASNPATDRKCSPNFAVRRALALPAAVLRVPPPRRFTVLSFQAPQHGVASSEPSISSEFTSSVGSPPLQLSHYTLSQLHINVLYVAACAVAISATWLFCSAIPTFLSFKRAAESLEKLMDVTREELPGTMEAVRLSGMEISDLTMELSDLGWLSCCEVASAAAMVSSSPAIRAALGTTPKGADFPSSFVKLVVNNWAWPKLSTGYSPSCQEITQGVRSSTRAVRMAEERLRRFANMNSTAPMQEVARIKTTTAEPALARSARGIREGIVKSRSVLQTFFALTWFSKLVINYLSDRSRRRALNK